MEIGRLDEYLYDLENRIQEETEEKLTDAWIDFVNHKKKSGYFAPERIKASEPGIKWPEIMINDAIEDYTRMAISELAKCSSMLERGGGELLSIRANYGTGIIPTMFGAPFFIMPYENNTLPCTRNLVKGEGVIEKLLEDGVPDLRAGISRRVFEFAEFYKEAIRNYPKIQKYVHVYVPDLQGPLSLTENLMGSDMYIDLYEEPEQIEAVLQLTTDTIIAMHKEWFSYFPAFSKDMCVDWGMLHRGSVMIRNDAAMNISGDCYEEFVQRYDQQILDAFEGGAIHFCGKGDHYIDRIADMRRMYAINMSQPEWNKMDIIYRHTIEKDIQIIGLNPKETTRASSAGIDLKGNVYSGVALSAWQKE